MEELALGAQKMELRCVHEPVLIIALCLLLLSSVSSSRLYPVRSHRCLQKGTGERDENFGELMEQNWALFLF